MIALWWAALRDRFGTAAMTFVLAMLAAGFAAAGPTYESAALQAVREAEVAEASVDELVIEATKAAPHKETDSPPALPYIRGMRTVHGRFVNGYLAAPRQTPLESRSGLCEHLPVVSGRCPTAGNEVAARRDMALHPGQDVDFTYELDEEPFHLRLTVVGVYDFLDVREPYWAGHDELIGAGFTGALLTTEQTMALVKGPMIERVDLVATPEAFTAEIPSELTDVDRQLSSGSYQVSTEILRLHERLEHSRAMLRGKLTAAVVPLVLTCWFVLFLAVSGAIRQRREELGLGALRGVPTWLRWVLPAMETALPVLAGALPGYLLGYFAVSATASGATVTQASVGYAAAAIGGALLAGLIAQAAALSTPVASLLRRVSRRGRFAHDSAWRLALELMAATFAVAVAYQAVVSGEQAQGLSMLAPMCLAVALGILAARFTARPAESLGRRALRRGRINLGMSLLVLARRSGHAATVVLLTVVIGIVGFAAVSAVSLRAAWEERAVAETASARVLSVAPVSTTKLLNAVRDADPTGRHAMAAVRLESSETGWVLGVDSPRLPSVAAWPAGFGPLPAETVSRLLRPKEPEPVLVRGETLALRLGLELADPKAAVRVTARLINSEGEEVLSRSPDLSLGTNEYVLNTKDCAAHGCRLHSIEIIMVAESGTKARLTMAPVAGSAAWRATGLKLDQANDGLRMDLEAANRVEMRLFPSVFPEPVPLVSSAAPPQELSSQTTTFFYQTLDAGRMGVTPRVGVGGHLIDLEYATLGATGTAHTEGEVWLAPGTPEDVVDRLRANGLTILDDRTMAERRALLHGQAPALTLSFLLLAAVAALLVGAAGLLVIAALERSRPEDGLGVLRVQGLSERTIAASAVGARVIMLAVAVVAGLAATAGSWLLVRRVMPPFLDSEWRAALPSAADVPVPAAAGGLGILVLAVACWAAAKLSNKESELS